MFTRCPWSVGPASDGCIGLRRQRDADGTVVQFSRCSSGTASRFSPLVFPIPPLPGNEVLTGQVTDRTTSAPLPGATVVFSQPHPSPYARTDGSGNYSLTGLPGPGGSALLWATAESYEEDLHYYRAASQDFRLYPIERIPAGGSTVVTLKPDDSLCWNNTHEPGYGNDYVCRKVRIVPTDGVMTVEALPMGGGSRPPLVVAVSAGNRLLVERMGNPVSVELAGGTEVIAFIAMVSGSADDAIVHVDDVGGVTMTGEEVMTRVEPANRLRITLAAPCRGLTSWAIPHCRIRGQTRG